MNSATLSVDDPDRLRTIRNQSGTLSSNRQEIAPANLERSRKHGVMVMSCQECGGRVLREDRGGPVVLHTHGCSVPARPRSWPKRPCGV